MPSAYSCLRFSTADQIHGDSCRRQTKLACEWCAKTGIPLVDTMKIAGTFQRPEEIEFFLRLHGLWEGVINLPRPPSPLVGRVLRPRWRARA